MAMTFTDLETIYRYWLYMEHDPDLLRIVTAAYLSVQYKGIPLWLLIIGSPGIGKSELLMGFATCNKTVMISKLSGNALATANKDAVPLLDQLKDHKVMIIKDMSTITELPSETRAGVFADLRDSYDGRFTRYTGMGEYKWEGKYNIIAGATPALERSRVHDAALGERFLQIRVKLTPEHERELQHRSFDNATKLHKIRKELMEATKKYIEETIIGIHAPVSVEMAKHLHNLAYMVAKIRSDVPRDRFTREIDSPSSSSEVPTRIVSQLFTMTAALIEIGTPEKDLRRIMERICLDTIPLERSKTLEAIVNGNKTVKAVARYIRVGSSTANRFLGDLIHLGIVELDDDGTYSIIDPLIGMVMLDQVQMVAALPSPAKDLNVS